MKSNPKSNLLGWQFPLSPEVWSRLFVHRKEWRVSPCQTFTAMEPDPGVVMLQLRALVTAASEGSRYSIPGQAGLGHLAGGSTWHATLQAQFGQLNSFFLPPTLLLHLTSPLFWWEALERLLFGENTKLLEHFGTTTEGLREELIRHTSCFI